MQKHCRNVILQLFLLKPIIDYFEPEKLVTTLENCAIIEGKLNDIPLCIKINFPVTSVSIETKIVSGTLPFHGNIMQSLWKLSGVLPGEILSMVPNLKKMQGKLSLDIFYRNLDQTEIFVIDTCTPLQKFLEKKDVTFMDILWLCGELCDALFFLEKHSIILQRNFTLEFIFISPEGFPILGDFSGALHVDDDKCSDLAPENHKFVAPEVCC